MSTPNPSTAERILTILTTANTAAPIVTGGVAALIDIFKKDENAQRKSDAEIEAQWNESMATALRTRDKAKLQQGDQA